MSIIYVLFLISGLLFFIKQRKGVIYRAPKPNNLQIVLILCITPVYYLI